MAKSAKIAFPVVFTKGIGKRARRAFGVVTAKNEEGAWSVLEECRAAYTDMRESGQPVRLERWTDALANVAGVEVLTTEEGAATSFSLGATKYDLPVPAAFVVAASEAGIGFRLGTACRDRVSVAVLRFERHPTAGYYPTCFWRGGETIDDETGQPQAAPLVGADGELLCRWAQRAEYERLLAGTPLEG